MVLKRAKLGHVVSAVFQLNSPDGLKTGDIRSFLRKHHGTSRTADYKGALKKAVTHGFIEVRNRRFYPNPSLAKIREVSEGRRRRQIRKKYDTDDVIEDRRRGRRSRSRRRRHSKKRSPSRRRHRGRRHDDVEDDITVARRRRRRSHSRRRRHLRKRSHSRRRRRGRRHDDDEDDITVARRRRRRSHSRRRRRGRRHDDVESDDIATPHRYRKGYWRGSYIRQRYSGRWRDEANDAITMARHRIRSHTRRRRPYRPFMGFRFRTQADGQRRGKRWGKNQRRRERMRLRRQKDVGVQTETNEPIQKESNGSSNIGIATEFTSLFISEMFNLFS